MCYPCLPDPEVDRVMVAAEAEWARGVAAGRYSDEDENAEDIFVATRMATEISLLPDCARLAEEWRAMLRSLKIPQDWLRAHGLIAG